MTAAPVAFLPLFPGENGELTNVSGTPICDAYQATYAVIPAERVTITPEPYTPKVGDRVMTTLGYEATIVDPELDRKGRIAVRWHSVDGDHYGTITPDQIDQAVQ